MLCAAAIRPFKKQRRYVKNNKIVILICHRLRPVFLFYVGKKQSA